MDVLRLGSIINAVAEKVSHVHSKNDIKQELWVKACEVLPKFTHLSEDDTKRIMFMVLRNKFRDILRFHRNRNPIVMDVGQLIDIGFKQISPDFETFTEPDFSNFSSKLGKEIWLWARHKDETTRNFVVELLDPSPETIQFWDSICEKPQYKSHMWIPPYTLATFLGINRVKCSKILWELRYFLRVSGFATQ